jgi:hypothetical protein
MQMTAGALTAAARRPLFRPRTEEPAGLLSGQLSRLLSPLLGRLHYELRPDRFSGQSAERSAEQRHLQPSEQISDFFSG